MNRGENLMKIKKFVGASMNECLLKVKRELGEDAVILDSRKVRRGGPFSFLLSDLVEVTACQEGPNQGMALGQRPSFWGESSLRRGGTVSGGGGSHGLVKSGMGRTASDLPARVGRNGAGGGNPKPLLGKGEAEEMALMCDDIRGLKETVAQITDHLKYQKLMSLPGELERVQRELLENGAEERAACSIVQEMALALGPGEFEDRTFLRRALGERLGQMVKAGWTENSGDRRRETGDRGPRVIALIGPTGVGKTTTLAKMATHPGIFGRHNVALVSADTYRLAAVEQLKTFASIAGLPMEAVYRPADMRRAMERFWDRDVILIDTAGRSQNDGGQLDELCAFMEYAQPDEIHLVLSVSTRLDDQLDVIAKFRAAGPKYLLFSKLDETTSYGMILNVCWRLSEPQIKQITRISQIMPISLLTCGQNVPDDIIAPQQAQLVRLVAERGYFREVFMEEVGLALGGNNQDIV